MCLKTASCNFSITTRGYERHGLYSKFDIVENKAGPTRAVHTRDRDRYRCRYLHRVVQTINEIGERDTALAGHFPVCFSATFSTVRLACTSREKQVSSRRCVCHRARQMLRRSNESHATAHATTPPTTPTLLHLRSSSVDAPRHVPQSGDIVAERANICAKLVDSSVSRERARGTMH